VVTNLGALSEPLWAMSKGVAVVPGPDPAALTAAAIEVLALSYESRLALGTRGAALYFSKFTLERTIERLRNPECTTAAPTSDWILPGEHQSVLQSQPGGPEAKKSSAPVRRAGEQCPTTSPS